jgi:hypothetical protein
VSLEAPEPLVTFLRALAPELAGLSCSAEPTGLIQSLGLVFGLIGHALSVTKPIAPDLIGEQAASDAASVKSLGIGP